MKKVTKGLVIGGSIVLGVALLVPIVAVVISGFKKRDTDSIDRKVFSCAEKVEADTNSFKKLNDIVYPMNEQKQYIDKKYVSAVNDFTNKIYKESLNKTNFGFAPLPLFFHYDILSGLSNETYKPIFDELLFSSSDLRNSEYRKAYSNNFYSNEDEGMYIYNGMFLDNSLNFKDEVLQFLTNKYVEAFNLSFSKDEDVNKMINWIIEHSPLDNFDKNTLGLNSNTKFVLNTNQYFSNRWGTIFDKKNTYKDKFTDVLGNQKEIEFMKHIISTKYCVYDDYFSFYDTYSFKFGYSIEYFVSTKSDVSIFDTIKNINIFNEDGSKFEFGNIDLSVPKFQFDYHIDVSNILKNTSFNVIYDNNPVFNSAFKQQSTDPIFLGKTIQNNKIVFNEDGTKVETVTFSLGLGASAPSPDTGYIVKLNEPFIYIIRDRDSLPIFVGQYAIPN